MNIVKIFKKRSESYFEILYKNIKVLQEITRVRRKKLLLKNINEQQDRITFADKRIETLFYEVYRKRFKNRELDAVVALLMKDLERFKFEETSSVPQSYEPQYTSFKNRYDKLRTINLLSHTARVFMVACKEGQDYPDRFMEHVAILALAHDFGKNPEVIDIASEGKKEKHNQISARYLGLVMRSMNRYGDDLISALEYALFFHHAPNVEANVSAEPVRNEYIDMLNKCDNIARDEELKIVNENIRIAKEEANMEQEIKSILQDKENAEQGA